MAGQTHTPGPWTLEITTPAGNAQNLAAWGKVRRPGRHTLETNLEDARLIAAAPALLAALEDVLAMIDRAPHTHPLLKVDRATGRAREAIAAAKGEA